MPKMKVKTFQPVEFKATAKGDKGEIEVVFATFNTIDSDGDVTEPGAFSDGAAVRISAYNHASWNPGGLPVGRGVISQGESDARMKGQFFLTTEIGRETFETVKQMGDLQEWSYGYDVLEGGPGSFEGQDVNFIRKSLVYEVAPVLIGAGVGTRTVAAKSGAKQLASDIYSDLREVGRTRFGGENTYVYVDDYDTDEEFVVYCVYDYNSGDDPKFVRVPFVRTATGSADPEVVLQAGETEVEIVTSYEPKSVDLRLFKLAASAKEAEEQDEDEDDGDEPKSGKKLTDDLTTVKTDVEEIGERLADVMATRAEKGKTLGSESKSAAEGLIATLDSTLTKLREVMASAEKSADDEPAPEENDEEPSLTLDDEAALAETLAKHGLSLSTIEGS